jgi:hypothetical protein
VFFNGSSYGECCATVGHVTFCFPFTKIINFVNEVAVAGGGGGKG